MSSATLKHRIPPTVVLDSGFAIEENITCLVVVHYRHLVVSREHHREFNAAEVVTVKDEGKLGIEVQRVFDADTGEVTLFRCRTNTPRPRLAQALLCNALSMASRKIALMRVWYLLPCDLSHSNTSVSSRTVVVDLEGR